MLVITEFCFCLVVFKRHFLLAKTFRTLLNTPNKAIKELFKKSASKPAKGWYIVFLTEPNT